MAEKRVTSHCGEESAGWGYLLGSSSEAFSGLSVLVGVMVSLGAPGLVGQAAGGFNEHGVQIMSPHYRFDPAAPAVVPKSDGSNRRPRGRAVRLRVSSGRLRIGDGSFRCAP